MNTASTKIFMNNRSQAVRLPKAVAFSNTVQEVEIIAIGNSRVITPKAESWDQWFENKLVSEDFMEQRLQEADQQREIL